MGNAKTWQKNVVWSIAMPKFGHGQKKKRLNIGMPNFVTNCVYDMHGSHVISFFFIETEPCGILFCRKKCEEYYGENKLQIIHIIEYTFAF